MAPVAELLADRYELGERIGAGGMGTVYRARDRRLDRDVAVKLPTTTLAPSQERFKREARAAARLNHPNVVGVYDWGDGDTPFIVMEYVEGASLREMLGSRGRLPAAEVARLGAQIADALAHAHRKGVVHRDVKPSNVLVTPDGAVKVTDFGIAQSSTGESLTEPGMVLGTKGYLSPEQVAGLPTDARSDVYSLGVVLAELLAGERPDGSEPPPVTDLERVITRARALDAAARHQRAGDLRDDLRRIARGEPIRDAATPLTAALVDEPTELPAPVHAPRPGRGAASPTAPTIAVEGTTVGTLTSALPVVPAPVAAPAPVVRESKPVKPPKERRTSRRELKALRPPKPITRPQPVLRRRWRARHLIALFTAPIVLAASGVFAYTALTDHPTMVAAPSVEGQQVLAAAAAMKQAHLKVTSVARDSARPGGEILTQTPRSGRRIEQGSTVRLVVSSTTAEVPDVVGLDANGAKAALQAVGLGSDVISDFRDDKPAGTITQVVPATSTRARKDAAVQLSVAQPLTVTIPNLSGVDQNAAAGALKNLGWIPAIKLSSSRSVPPNSVISVIPAAGKTATRGETITLVVSTGRKQVTVPPTVGMSRGDAVSKLEDAGFDVAVNQLPSAAAQDGKVIAQTPAGGKANEGSTVTITVGVKSAKSNA